MNDKYQDQLADKNTKRFSCCNSTSMIILISLGDYTKKQGRNETSLFKLFGNKKNRKNNLKEFTEQENFNQYIEKLKKVSEGRKPDVYMVNIRFHIFRILGNLMRVRLFSWIANKNSEYEPFRKDHFGNPFDLLIKVECEDQFASWILNQTDVVLSDISKQYREVSSELLYSSNYNFYGSINTSEKILLSGFLARWKENEDKIWQKSYWLNNHGPYAMKLGLPGNVKSYVQTHWSKKSIINKPISKGSSLHPEYEGIAFQTIDHSKFGLVRLAFFGIVLNIKLVVDEIKWTKSAQYLMFEPVVLKLRNEGKSEI